MGHGLDQEGKTASIVDNTGQGKTDWLKKKQQLSRLATRMKLAKNPFDPPNTDNHDIPAGYTYLGQIIAHDMVASDGRFPVEAHQGDVRNFRKNPLLLECIYGGGPALTPLPYAIEEGQGSPRKKFRMGKTRKNKRGNVADGAERDIARVACPYMSGQAPVDETTNPPRQLPTDVLIADARNDDNLILSQMTALFQHFHNKVVDTIESVHKKNPPSETVSDAQLFDLARSIVVRTYRKILRKDYLGRVINKEVFDNCDAAYENFLSAKTKKMTPSTATEILNFKDGKIPLEFSHAAFRFGHGMVRPVYDLNEQRKKSPTNRGARISRIIEFTSSRRASDMPLSCDWLIDGWWRFFDVFPKDKKLTPNFSRLITPFVAPSLVTSNLIPTTDGLPGSLLFRDFVRAESVGVRKVDWLLKKFGLSDADNYPLADKTTRANAISDWIGNLSPSEFPTQEDVRQISKNPPLLFYILLEAEVQEKGKRLGTLGSLIIAGVIYHALEQTSSIEQAGSTTGVEKMETVIFGKKSPETMPDLLTWLGVAKNWSQCSDSNNGPAIC